MTAEADTESTGHPLMTPGQVAEQFAVNVKTVSRWADSGRLSVHRTLGGHRRFVADEVAELLADLREIRP
jgi:excisionase family DNA binding protein